MAKKKLTPKQNYTKYKSLQFSCIGGEVISVLTPFIILGAVNYQDWFVSEEGWKVGLGGSLALALMGVAIFLVTQKKEKDLKITDGWIALIVGWFAVAFIFVLLANIMDQIATIMLWGGLGLCGAFGLDMTSKAMKNKADKYKSAIEKAEEDIIKEEVKKQEGQAVE